MGIIVRGGRGMPRWGGSGDGPVKRVVVVVIAVGSGFTFRSRIVYS